MPAPIVLWMETCFKTPRYEIEAATARGRNGDNKAVLHKDEDVERVLLRTRDTLARATIRTPREEAKKKGVT